MIATLIAATWVCLTGVNPYADLLQEPVDSNTAFYEGDSTNYIFPAPPGFRMVTDEAQADGLSFAFVPKDQSYDTAGITIAVTIYDLSRDRADKISYQDVVREDTVRLRKYYGPELRIWKADSVFSGTGEIVPTLYFSAEKVFIPTVMVSYYDGGHEVIIVELSVSEQTPRFDAEPIFEKAMRLFKPLRKRSLVVGDASPSN